MYAKVFRSLWDGTLADSWETWSVFVFLLAHADMDGTVEMTHGAIARRACIPLDKVKAAIAHLEANDPDSRTPDENGARLVKIADREWGWRIVNYLKYRSLRDQQMVRAQTAERVKRHKERKKVTQGNAPVTQGNAPKRHVEGEVEADVEAEALPSVASLPTAVKTHPSASDDAAGFVLTEPNGNGSPPEDPDDREETPAQWADGFTGWWAEYPRKVNKESARQEYLKIRPRSQRTYDLLFAGLELHKRKEWADLKPDQKPPHASTWLHQRRYCDAATED
jgi:hypothetical protein